MTVGFKKEDDPKGRIQRNAEITLLSHLFYIFKGYYSTGVP